jgi:Flp pilus assembly protein TadD
MKRMIQRGLLPCVLMLAGCASPSANKPPERTINVVTPSSAEAKVEDADNEQVLKGVKMIEAGQIQAAIDGPLDELVHRYEAKYGNSKVKVYSARGMADALLYEALSATTKPPVSSLVVGPAWAMGYWARGYAYNEMARYDEAIVELRKALALAPVDAQYQVELAYAYQQKHDWEQSLALYHSALDYAEITASDTLGMKCRALRGQGYDLVELHRLDEAEAAYRACLELKPNEPRSLGELEYIRRLRVKAKGGIASFPPPRGRSGKMVSGTI